MSPESQFDTRLTGHETTGDEVHFRETAKTPRTLKMKGHRRGRSRGPGTARTPLAGCPGALIESRLRLIGHASSISDPPQHYPSANSATFQPALPISSSPARAIGGWPDYAGLDLESGSAENGRIRHSQPLRTRVDGLILPHVMAVARWRGSRPTARGAGSGRREVSLPHGQRQDGAGCGCCSCPASPRCCHRDLG